MSDDPLLTREPAGGIGLGKSEHSERVFGGMTAEAAKNQSVKAADNVASEKPRLWRIRPIAHLLT